MKINRIILLTLMLVSLGSAVLTVSAQDATAEAAAEAAAEATESATQLNVFENFYNAPAGWHAQIPTGWTNASTGDSAHFTSGDQSIFVFGYPDAAEADAVTNALTAAGVTVTGEPADTRSVNLINGTWVQRLYIDGDQRVLAHVQNFDGTQYVMVFVGTTAAVPFVIMSDGALEDTDLLQEAMTDATQIVLPDAAAGVPTAATNPGTPPTVLQVYDSGVTAVGYARGNAVFTAAGTGGADQINTAAGYFNTLSVFFITPRTQPYLLLGLALAGAIMVLLVVSLYVRYRNLLKDEATLKALDEE